MTVLTAIGLMSGTSLDGIDAAIIRTDGENHVEVGESIHAIYARDLKVIIRRAITAALEGRDGATDIGRAEGEITWAHVTAVEALLEKAGLKRTAIDVIGFAGQTILHRPKRCAETPGRTWQIGDGALLARETKIDVVSNFREADIAAGGEGAPFAPIYHAALARQLFSAKGGATAILNIGGVANVTYVPPEAGDLDILAFDCGPGNGLIDQWMEAKTGAAMDEDGKAAIAGSVNETELRMMLLHPFLRRRPPKSADRHDFNLDLNAPLSVNDGAATLAAFTAACVKKSEAFLPEPPARWIVAGGGRRNPAIMLSLSEMLEGEVLLAEEAGWRGDDLEAECFGYLAVRSLRKLPISFPKTTRVPRPLQGGVFHRAPL